MEINTDQLNKESKAIYLEHNKEVGHDHLCLVKTQGQAED